MESERATLPFLSQHGGTPGVQKDGRSPQPGIMGSATGAPCGRIWRGQQKHWYLLQRQRCLGEMPRRAGSSRKRGRQWSLWWSNHTRLSRCAPTPICSSPPVFFSLCHTCAHTHTHTHTLASSSPQDLVHRLKGEPPLLSLSSPHVLTVPAASASRRRGLGFSMASIMSIREVLEPWFFPIAPLVLWLLPHFWAQARGHNGGERIWLSQQLPRRFA